MKTKIITLVALMCMLMANKSLMAQPVPFFVLTNNTTCDVTLNYEQGDPLSCIPFNSPCTWATIVVPAFSSITLFPCTGSPTIDELCIVPTLIGTTPISGSHTFNSVGCCMVGNIGLTGSYSECRAGLPLTWTISRWPGNWLIQ